MRVFFFVETFQVGQSRPCNGSFMWQQLPPATIPCPAALLLRPQETFPSRTENERRKSVGNEERRRNQPCLASPFLYGLQAVQYGRTAEDIIPYSKLLTTVEVCLYSMYCKEKNGNKEFFVGQLEPGFAMALNN